MMKALVLIFLIGLVAINCELSPDVLQLTNDYWDWRAADMPEFASFVGIHDFDDKMDDLSLEAFEERKVKSDEFFARAEALEGNHTEHDDVINLKEFKSDVKTFIDGYGFQGFLMPMCYSEGIHVNLERLISYMVFQNAQDYDALLSRFENVPHQMQQTELLMRNGVSQGLVYHQISMKGVPESLDRFVVDRAEDSPLWSTFEDMSAANLTQEETEDIRNRARTTIVETVSPAFLTLKSYIENDYETRPEIGVTSLPDGIARYDALLKFHTSTDLSPIEIHEMGLEEVVRITDEMAKIIEALGYNMTVPEFSDMMRKDPNNFYDNPDEFFAAFEDLVYNVISPRMPDLFLRVPEAKLSVVAAPAPDGPAAFYLAGAYDGSRPGVFYVNTAMYDANPKYNFMTLSLHEGNPGHHLQSAYAIEDPTIPFYRRVSDDRNYCYSPSRFPMNTAYAEGWGLYSEDLGFDLQLYEDLLVRYGHYSMEIFRASRMVVDTGMHALDWTRDQAVFYMLEHTAQSEGEIQNEVDRYITWPGQAVAYKVGELKLRELRDRASQAFGAEFDLKKFHDIVLKSVGPLDLLEEEVDAWISGGQGK